MFVESLILQPKDQGQAIEIPANLDFIKVAELINEKLIREKPKLTFDDVVKGLREGKKFKRKEWSGYLYWSAKARHNKFRLRDRSFKSGLSFYIEDFEATDWEEVK